MDAQNETRTYGPLVAECLARGIGRSTAFEMARDGTLETFKIGTRRFVYLESLATLPKRLAERDKGAAS